MKRLVLAAALALAGLALAPPRAATAAFFDFSFTQTGGFSGDASGTFEVSGSTIVGITGTTSLWGPMTGLLAPGSYQGNDNRFSATSPFLSFNGVSFTTGTRRANLYFSGVTWVLLTDPLTFLSSANGFGSLTVTPTPAAVPAPAPLALFALGLAGLGLVRRRAG